IKRPSKDLSTNAVSVPAYRKSKAAGFTVSMFPRSERDDRTETWVWSDVSARVESGCMLRDSKVYAPGASVSLARGFKATAAYAPGVSALVCPGSTLTVPALDSGNVNVKAGGGGKVNVWRSRIGPPTEAPR